MHRQEKIQAFVSHLWSWYSLNKRQLPWRDLWHLAETDRAYRILVSEVMLQQTQVPRVKIIFKNFLERFPWIEDLAAASNRDVLLAWRGMGYNSRALRLRDGARWIVKNFLKYPEGAKRFAPSGYFNSAPSGFPKEMHDLLRIPGVGHYTAAAIRNFAFNLPTPCLDTNIRRVLHRAFVGKENRDGTWRKDDAYLLKLAGEVLDYAISRHSSVRHSSMRSAAEWHSALMDYGSMVEKGSSGKKKRTEPGRLVGSRFIPNRIFRGKIIEALRDAGRGFELAALGERVCSDWNERRHRRWLRGVIERLMCEQLIAKRGAKFVLKD